MSWVVSRHSGTADELHRLDPPPGRRVLLMELTAPAIVLGSTQRDDLVDAGAADRFGIEVVRRHTGGGLVLLRPGEFAWVDVVIPSGDPLWSDDVGVAFEWLGAAWASVIGPGAEVHRGAPEHADLGRIVCFGGVGSGEVLVGGRKVVGISQRRTRDRARFQCLAHEAFDASGTLALLTPGAVDPSTGERLITRLETAVGTVAHADDVVRALVERLPD